MTTQKYLYLVNYFVPQYQSEYGGLIAAIAESEEECFNIITQWDNDTWTEYYPKLRENIIKAEKFSLSDDEETRIVEAFVT